MDGKRYLGIGFCKYSHHHHHHHYHRHHLKLVKTIVAKTKSNQLLKNKKIIINKKRRLGYSTNRKGNNYLQIKQLHGLPSHVTIDFLNFEF